MPPAPTTASVGAEFFLMSSVYACGVSATETHTACRRSYYPATMGEPDAGAEKSRRELPIESKEHAASRQSDRTTRQRDQDRARGTRGDPGSTRLDIRGATFEPEVLSMSVKRGARISTASEVALLEAVELEIDPSPPTASTHSCSSATRSALRRRLARTESVTSPSCASRRLRGAFAAAR